MNSSSVSGMMEKKIKLLENRLSLVERFVEMRFCESFRDFSIRNNSLVNGEDDTLTAVDKLEGRGKCSTISVKIIKATALNADKSAESCPSPPSRRSIRISAKERKQGRGKGKVQKEHVPKTKEEEPLTSEVAEGQELEAEEDSTLIQQVEEDGGDGYFTFPAGGGDGGQKEEEEEETMEHEDHPLHDSDDNWSEADKSPPKKKRIFSAGAGAKKVKRKYKTRQRSVNVPIESLLSTKECPICHVQCKPSAYPAHMAMHGKERHLKCGFCDKRFHNRPMLFKHERIHQPEKYGKICRVKGCGKMIIQTTRMLGHERSCIRKALENGVEVDREVMEEVRRRSLNVDLNWPGEEGMEGSKRRCRLCGREVERKEWMKHMRGHARWKCEKCGDKVAVFTEKRSLLRHNRHFHGGKGESSGEEQEEHVEGMKGENDESGEIVEGMVVEVIGEEEVRKIMEN